MVSDFLVFLTENWHAGHSCLS